MAHENPRINPATDDPDASLQYLRQARRLRHRLRDDPSALHASLRRLSLGAQRTAAPAREPFAPELPLQADPATVAAFARQVADALDGFVLRYSNRLALLEQAGKLGINRFEANLIIAAVQYRHGTATPEPQRRSRWPLLVAFAIAVQAMIVFAVWKTFGA